MTRAVTDAVLSALSARRPVAASVLLLVAHPDDEVLGASVTLRCAERLRLVHATDGSGGDAVITAERFRELLAALESLDVEPTIAPCGYPDGSLIGHAAALAEHLAGWLSDTDVLITHAFEGGHPDHDACALAAQLACTRELERSGRRVARLEFAIYARIDGAIRTNAFPPADAVLATTLQLSPEEQARKRRSLQAFASQRHVVDRFPLATETLRPTPEYDFSVPRDPAQLLFAFGEPSRETRWREAAAAALTR